MSKKENILEKELNYHEFERKFVFVSFKVSSEIHSVSEL
jgi:hypothetical protein